MKRSTEVAIIVKRINYNSAYYLISPNIASGRRSRYDVRRIPTSTGKRIKIIGREVTLSIAKGLIRKDRQYLNK